MPISPPPRRPPVSEDSQPRQLYEAIRKAARQELERFQNIPRQVREEIEQDTCLVILGSNLSSEVQPGQVRGLARRIAHNRALDELRRLRTRERHAERAEEASVPSQDDPEQQLIREQERAAATLAIAQLGRAPSNALTALQLEVLSEYLKRHLDMGVPIQELAREKGLTDNAYRNRLWRARAAALKVIGPLNSSKE